MATPKSLTGPTPGLGGYTWNTPPSVTGASPGLGGYTWNTPPSVTGATPVEFIKESIS